MSERVELRIGMSKDSGGPMSLQIEMFKEEAQQCQDIIVNAMNGEGPTAMKIGDYVVRISYVNSVTVWPIKQESGEEE